MATLWKRANGPQYRMLQMIAGAVMNTLHVHPPAANMPWKYFARSVAKRAVGTISAQWVELLAAERPSGGRSENRDTSDRLRRSPLRSAEKGRSQLQEAAPFNFLCKELSVQMGRSWRNGDMAGDEACREAIRILAPLARRERGKPPLVTKADPRHDTLGIAIDALHQIADQQESLRIMNFNSVANIAINALAAIEGKPPIDQTEE